MECPKCWRVEMTRKIHKPKRGDMKKKYIFKEFFYCPKCKRIQFEEKNKTTPDEFYRQINEKQQTLL